MERRNFLKHAVGGALAIGTTWQLASAIPPDSQQQEGRVLEGFYPSNIVAMKDGSLLTDKWERSTDGGQTWTKLKPPLPRGDFGGMKRLPNGDLGYYTEHHAGSESLTGPDANKLLFYRSTDDGQTWSASVRITLPGVVYGLDGTIFTLASDRIVIVTYSQFLTREKLWGGSWGTYKGARVKTETEGHFAEMEAVRVYYSDDSGSKWSFNDGWVMGWREKKYTDSFVEASGVELRDGRLLLIGRTLNSRLYQATSTDQGGSWSYATPTDLMSSDSPGWLAKFPHSGDLLIVWNQVSREENCKGFRRCRLSSAVSQDDGRTWEHFKTLEHGGLPAVGRLPPDPDLTPNWGADSVGELPDDYAYFHYPSVNIVGNEVYVSYLTGHYEIEKDAEGFPTAEWRSGTRTRVLPLEWFYS